MKIIESIRIDDPGDPDVGIFSSYWDINGDMYFEDQSELNGFLASLRDAFEYVTTNKISITLNYKEDEKSKQ